MSETRRVPVPLFASIEVMKILPEHRWEGNVRELKYLIERTMNVMETKEAIEIHDLPEDLIKQVSARQENATTNHRTLSLFWKNFNFDDWL